MGQEEKMEKKMGEKSEKGGRGEEKLSSKNF